MKSMWTALLAIGAVGGVAICDLCGGPAARLSRGAVAMPATTPTTVLHTVTLRVAGMTCGGCVVGVRTVLARLDGVTRADASYEPPRAVVTFDPSRVTVDRLVAAIGTLGYRADTVTVTRDAGSAAGGAR